MSWVTGSAFVYLSAVKILAVFGLLILIIAFWTLVERRGAGFIQNRLGPNRVGPGGLFQCTIVSAKPWQWRSCRRRQRMSLSTVGIWRLLKIRSPAWPRSRSPRTSILTFSPSQSTSTSGARTVVGNRRSEP